MGRSLPIMVLALMAVISVVLISFTFPGYRTTLITYSNSAAEGESACQKQRTDIFFLKTHKCASSTVQNILMRYGVKNKLDFVLPAEYNYLGNPKPFVPSLIGEDLRTHDGKYHIFTHHTRYNASGMREVMRADAAFVTIMRHPTKLFESLYSYYAMEGYFHMPLLQFIRLPLAKVEQMVRQAGKIGINQMSWDLGTEVYGFRNEELLQALIRHVETHFDLVMIAEYMEASLILLKELMCWELDDIVFLSLNARSASAHTNLTDWDRRRIAELNSADVVLYEHFIQRFKERVREFGPSRMRAEVDALLHRNADLYRVCVKGVQTPGNPRMGYNDVRYQLHDDLGDMADICRLLVISELKFTSMLREQQARRLRVLRQFDLLVKDIDPPGTTSAATVK